MILAGFDTRSRFPDPEAAKNAIICSTVVGQLLVAANQAVPPLQDLTLFFNWEPSRSLDQICSGGNQKPDVLS